MNLFVILVIAIIVALVFLLKDTVLLVLLGVGLVGTGWWAYHKVQGSKSLPGRTTGLPPLAARESKRRKKERCLDAKLCKDAPNPQKHMTKPQQLYPAIDGRGKNSICNDQVDECPPCYNGVRQSTIYGGNYCGIDDDPNFAPFGNRHGLYDGMTVEDDHSAATAAKALYMDERNRIYMRDRNGLMMARNMRTGSSRPHKDYGASLQGFISTVVAPQNMKSDYYMELVDPRLDTNKQFKQFNYT